MRDFRAARPPMPGDAGVAALAAVQEGMVSVAQLRAAGLSRDAIRRRVEKGWLHPVGRGAYAVGHPRSAPLSRAWAAWLASPETAHTGLSGAWLLGLRLTPPRRMHLSSMTKRRSTVLAQLHHRPNVTGASLEQGLPCVALEHVLLECATHLPQDQLAKLVHRAEELRILDLNPIRPLLAAHRGSPALRAALETHLAEAHEDLRSELERRFRRLLAAHGLPQPVKNTMVEGFLVDGYYPEHRVVVELDSRLHDLTRKRERDTYATAILLARGYTVVRFTWAQVVHDPAHVIGTLTALLDQRRRKRAGSG